MSSVSGERMWIRVMLMKSQVDDIDDTTCNDDDDDNNDIYGDDDDVNGNEDYSVQQ